MAKLNRGKVGSLIRIQRTMKDWTQEELARRAHLERGHLARIETGKTVPGLATRKRLAKALHLDPLVLLAA